MPTTNQWRGDASAVAQVSTITLAGTIATGQLYTVTINGKSVTYSALVSDSNTTAATALQTNLAASAVPEFLEVTWANPSAGVITGTATTAGQPFTSTSSATGTGTLVTQAGIAQPVISSTSTTSPGGTLVDATTYYYRLTALNAAGETTPSIEVSRLTLSPGGTSTITLNWSAPAGTGITGYKIYGRTTGAEQLIATVGAGTTSYVDTGTPAPSGALPTVNTTVSSGPNDASVPGNWSAGVYPATGDTVVFDNNSVDCLYGLAALAAVQPANININAGYTGKIGLPAYNGSYFEYRQAYLQFQGCSGQVNVGYGVGSGSGRIKLDFQSTNAFTLNVQFTSRPIDTQFGVNQALLVKGVKTTSVINVNRGTVGLAVLSGEVTTIGTLNIGYVSQILGDATVYCGTGVTFNTAINQSGGTLTLQSAVTTFTQTGGVCYHTAGLITTATVNGTLWEQMTGTFATTINVLGAGVLDCSQDMRSRTAGTVNLYKGATVNDPFGTLFAGGPTAVKTVQCALQDVKLNLGINHLYTPS